MNTLTAAATIAAGLALGYLTRGHLDLARPWLVQLVLVGTFVGWAVRGGMDALK